MAEQVAANLNNRPVAVVWSKSDKIDNVPRNIRDALEEDLIRLFNASQVFRVSNFSKSDPDVLCHENNLIVIDYLLEKLNEPRPLNLIPRVEESDDLFFNYGEFHGK